MWSSLPVSDPCYGSTHIASEDFLLKTGEKAADTHHGEQHLIFFQLFCIVTVADSATQLRNSCGRSHNSEQHLVHFQIFYIIPIMDSATQHLPCGGFCHAATKIAASAPVAGIRSQAKRTTAKLEYLKFTNKNEFKKNKHAPRWVEMCEQYNEIIKGTSKSRETIPLIINGILLCRKQV
jgi:hypothetical protein